MTAPYFHFPADSLPVPAQRRMYADYGKRLFDLAALVLMAPVILPVVFLIVGLVTVTGTKPFYAQERVGRDGRTFEIVKFRTMVADAEARRFDLAELNDMEGGGPLFKIHDDPRITRVGAVLRKWSIDELPQLWNVLRGDMSLVGPRPALPHETEEWDALLSQRLRVKPGITGMWQVNGRSDTSFEDYTRLDLYYVDNWSLATDLAILAKTIPVVLLRQGAR